MNLGIRNLLNLRQPSHRSALRPSVYKCNIVLNNLLFHIISLIGSKPELSFVKIDVNNF